MLTVFTPTFNRKHTLQRVFNSLKNQTNYNFEWLIIDDGSTDDTEELINDFLKENSLFSIRYYKQAHRGKPSAQNWALDLAKGEYFITCDSNKCLDNNAVKNIISMFNSIDNPNICGVGGYRADFSGNIYGGKMKLDNNQYYIDCSNIDRYKYNLQGDKATAFRTDILRNYKSPIFEGEYFITEAVWLISMALDGYEIRWFPKILCYGEYDIDGLTKQGANSYIGHYNNFQGYLEYVRIEIKAGYNCNTDYLIVEAVDIAKKKNIKIDNLSNKLSISKRKIYLIYVKQKIKDYFIKLKSN